MSKWREIIPLSNLSRLTAKQVETLDMLEEKVPKLCLHAEWQKNILNWFLDAVDIGLIRSTTAGRLARTLEI